MKKLDKFFILSLSIMLFCIYIIAGIGVFTGKYKIDYFGFAVDSKDNVYIGCLSEIKVYNNGRFVKSIYPQTNRGYDITIIDNDIIYIMTGEGSYSLDVDGNLLEYSDYSSSAFHKYRPNKQEYITSDGDFYEQKFNFGRTKIIKEINGNEETVFQMPLNDYSVKLIWYSGFLLIFIIFIFVLRHRLGAIRNLAANRTGDGSVSCSQKS